MFRTGIATSSRRLTANDVAVSAGEWSRAVAATGSDSPTLVELERALRDRDDLDRDTRAAVRSVLGAAREPVRAPGSRAITQHGIQRGDRLDVLSLRAGRRPEGAPERVEALESVLRQQLWGQQGAVAVLTELGRRHVSPLRPQPAAGVVSGPRGHGKDQAIRSFADGLFSTDAEVVTVDFEGVTDRDVARLFSDEGPLDPVRLQQVDAVLHLQGTEGLVANAPKVFRALASHLLRRTDEEGYVDAPVVFDFDTEPGEPVQPRLVGALDYVAENVQPHASFGRLDADAMVRYAEVWLQERIAKEGSGIAAIELSPAAARFLGEALATPHAPLERMANRLYQLVVASFDTHTSILREEGSVLRLDPHPDLSQSDLDSVVAQLHASVWDPRGSDALFYVREVGVQNDNVDRTEQLQRMESLPEQLTGLAESLRSEARAIDVSIRPLLTAIATLARSSERLSREAEEGRRFERRDVFSVSALEAWGAALEACVTNVHRSIEGLTGTEAIELTHQLFALDDLCREAYADVSAITSRETVARSEVPTDDVALVQKLAAAAGATPSFLREAAGEAAEDLEPALVALEGLEAQLRAVERRLLRRLDLGLSRGLAPFDFEVVAPYVALAMVELESHASDPYAPAHATAKDLSRILGNGLEALARLARVERRDLERFLSGTWKQLDSEA